jgi:hypothetical protein
MSRDNADDLVSQLVAIDGPCACASQICAHWQSEAGIILTATLQHREQEIQEQAVKVLTDRLDELQAEWDAPPSAKNGFIEMTADTPAGYATWYCVGQLRKLAQTIRRRDDTPQEGEQQK